MNHEIAAILRAAKALIFKSENWTKGATARDFSGDMVCAFESEAVCWCAQGAIARGRRDIGMTAEASDRALAFLASKIGNVPGFNDSSTHAEVIAAFDTAITQAEAM